MRVRNVALIVAVFGAAAGAAAFVVRQLPLEGEVSPLPPAPLPDAPAETSPPLVPAAGPGDADVEVRVTAGPEPLAGAEVRLYAAPGAPAAPWRRAGEARTDGSGLARIPARPGTYLAAARAPGLAPGRAEVVRAGEGAARAEIVLAPPAVLSGRATAPGGRPLAAARVRLVPRFSRWPAAGPPTAPPEETVELRTDAAGAFRAVGLSPGAWALSVDAPGYHPVSLPRLPVPGPPVKVTAEPLGTLEGVALLPDGRPAAGAAVRAVSPDHGAGATAGPDGRFRVALEAGSYALLATLGARGGSEGPVSVGAGATSHAPALRLEAAGTIAGEVTRGAAPAAGAELVLVAHRTREVVTRGVADARGRFTLGPLAPASYDLAAAAPGASPVLLEGLGVGGGQRFAARVALGAPGAVVGTVRDPDGHALVGVQVRAAGPAAGPLALPPVEGRTDFEGRFRLAPLPPGRVEVVAREERLAVGVARGVDVAEGRDAPVALVLPPAGVLAGRVADRGRPPPEGTTVVAVPLRRGEGSVETARAPADAQGYFELALPAGEYRVYAAPGTGDGSDLRVAPAFVRVDGRRTTRADLALAPPDRDGAEILVLEPGGSPSPGATVTLARPDDGRAALALVAGDDGRVRVGAQMGVAGRPVTIRARNGGRTGETTVTFPDAGTVAVHLAAGGAVAGVVRGARGGFTLEVSSRPAAGSWRTVEVHRFSGDRFALGDLPAAPLRLVARADDGRAGTADVRLEPGETRSVEIALREARARAAPR